MHLSDALMEECVRMMQQNLRAAPTIKQRAKSVKAQRNLGTIKDRKREKRKETESSNGEIIMRILRMRYVSFSPHIDHFTSVSGSKWLTDQYLHATLISPLVRPVSLAGLGLRSL